MKKLFLIITLIPLLFSGCINTTSGSFSSQELNNTQTNTQQKQILEHQDVINYNLEKKTNNSESVPSNLSNDNYYVNVDGEHVHSPAYAPSIPAGASAKCRDGTYSFSKNRRGTCSGHGGVATWY